MSKTQLKRSSCSSFRQFLQRGRSANFSSVNTFSISKSLQLGVQSKLESRMPDVKQAVGYQQISAHFQRQDGKRFLEDARPCPGDSILDLGCGTGELSAYLAQLVRQEGKVVAVDPDVDRIQVAQKSHISVKNLVFLEGSASNFPRMGTETYDIIFCNYVLHWIQEKKKSFSGTCSAVSNQQERLLCSTAITCRLYTITPIVN